MLAKSGPGEGVRCLVIANGDIPSRRFLKRLARDADLVLATDGAAGKLLAAGVRPHRVIGDFDSIDPAVLNSLPQEARLHVPDQDRCDLDKALSCALELAPAKVTVAGGLGRRLDHSLTTVSLLIRYAPDLRLRLVEPGAVVIPVVDHETITGQVGDTLSLIALQPVKGVTLTGVRWPLQDEDLEPGSRGVSNILTAETVHVGVRSGCLLVCHLLSGRQTA